VQLLVYSDDRGMTEHLRKTLHNLINEHEVDPQDIVILTPRSPGKSTLSRLSRLGSFLLTPNRDTDYNEIFYESIYAFKGLLVLFDILTMFLLIGLMRSYGLEEIRFFVYAWNPLVVYEIAQGGHLEGLVILLVVLSLYLFSINRKTLSVLILALASGLKLFPAFLLPAIVNRGERLKAVLTFSLCFLVMYLPYCRSADTKNRISRQISRDQLKARGRRL